jgi:hypothetical protein
MSNHQDNNNPFYHRVKWVSKYVSRPLLIIILLCVVMYYLFPGALESIGIDVAHLSKYAFWFFLGKGILWIVVFIYGYVFWRKKRKGNSDKTDQE